MIREKEAPLPAKGWSSDIPRILEKVPLLLTG